MLCCSVSSTNEKTCSDGMLGASTANVAFKNMGTQQQKVRDINVFIPISEQRAISRWILSFAGIYDYTKLFGTVMLLHWSTKMLAAAMWVYLSGLQTLSVSSINLYSPRHYWIKIGYLVINTVCDPWVKQFAQLCAKAIAVGYIRDNGIWVFLDGIHFNFPSCLTWGTYCCTDQWTTTSTKNHYHPVLLHNTSTRNAPIRHWPITGRPIARFNVPGHIGDNFYRSYHQTNSVNGWSPVSCGSCSNAVTRSQVCQVSYSGQKKLRHNNNDDALCTGPGTDRHSLWSVLQITQRLKSTTTHVTRVAASDSDTRSLSAQKIAFWYSEYLTGSFSNTSYVCDSRLSISGWQVTTTQLTSLCSVCSALSLTLQPCHKINMCILLLSCRRAGSLA